MKPLHVIQNIDRETINLDLQNPIHYRKSGLSLNHIIGCPMDCAYCVRHKDDNWEMKHPQLLMSDEDAVDLLIAHKYFKPNLTPIQIFNKATDCMLPNVKPHLFNVLRLLDGKGYNNHVLIITRFKVLKEDCMKLNNFKNLKITLLITYSGITNNMIEPINNEIPINSLKTSFENAINYKTILYWRPIVPGLNDSDKEIDFCLNELSKYCHAVVYTGLFFSEKVKLFFDQNNLPSLYNNSARRKIFPDKLERKIIMLSKGSKAEGKLFKKTSCGVAFVHKVNDYNGHYGIKEICELCPKDQIKICASNYTTPTFATLEKLALSLEISLKNVIINKGISIELESVTEDQRYYLQHNLNFQVHNKNYPHRQGQHGRADEFRNI